MCQICHCNPCASTCPTIIRYVACPQFPPAPGPPGPQGPASTVPGPPGPPPSLVIVNIDDTDSPYQVIGDEDVILVNTTNGPVNINLLAANDPAVIKRVSIKDAFGTSAINSIAINQFGADTIDTVAAPKFITTPFESLEFTSNLTTGYNIT